jgi:hypothetical protein
LMLFWRKGLWNILVGGEAAPGAFGPLWYETGNEWDTGIWVYLAEGAVENIEGCVAGVYGV